MSQPETGLDCLICAIFGRQRGYGLGVDAPEGRCRGVPFLIPLSSKLGTNKPVKVRFWPWPEPFFRQTDFVPALDHMQGRASLH